MDIQQNNVAVLHFNLVNQDGSTIFIRKTKLATFNLINPSEVSVPITDIGFDATLNQCWVRIPKASNATTGQYYGVLNIVDDDWGTYTTSKIKVYSVVSDADEDTKSIVFTATCIATQVTNPGGGNSPYYNATTSTWWQYSDTLKAFEDTGVGNLIKYITKNVQHLKDGTGNGSVVTCLDDEISANNTATGLCSTDLGKNNNNRGESCVALGENNYIAEGVSNATAIAGAQPSAVDVFAIGDKTAGHKNVFEINKFGDIYFRPDSSQERTTILQDILNSVIKNVFYDSSNYSLTVTFYSAADNANKTKTYDLSGLKAVLKDDAVKEISVNQSTAVMTVTTINGSSQQIQLPTSEVKSFVRIFQADSPVCFDAVTDQDGTTKTLYSPALFIKEPQTSLVLNNVQTGNSGGKTEYFKWFYDQHHITDGASYATNTFFNLPIDFATKPDCTPFDSSHVIVPTLSCMNGALALCQKKLTAGTNITITDDGVISVDPLTAVPGSILTGTTTISTTGNAATATKLANARTINIAGASTGSVSFDGSSDVTINTVRRSCSVGQSSGTATNPWYKVASCSISDAAHNDLKITFQVNGWYSSDDIGILSIRVRVKGDGTYDSSSMVWEVASNGIALGDFVLAYNEGVAPTICEFWVYIPSVYYFYKFNVIEEGNKTENYNAWTLYDLNQAGYASAPTSGYALKASTLATLKNNAATATKATQDGSGNVITSTYLPLAGGTLTGDLTCNGDIYYKKLVSTADISNGVLNINSLTKFINISTGNGTITSINKAAAGYNAGDEIILCGTFTYNVDGSSFKVADGAMKIVYTGAKFVRLY